MVSTTWKTMLPHRTSRREARGRPATGAPIAARDHLLRHGANQPHITASSPQISLRSPSFPNKGSLPTRTAAGTPSALKERSPPQFAKRKRGYTTDCFLRIPSIARSASALHTSCMKLHYLLTETELREGWWLVLGA
jgi:hypothetical protein